MKKRAFQNLNGMVENGPNFCRKVFTGRLTGRLRKKPKHTLES